jgi:hypothetical protein
MTDNLALLPLWYGNAGDYVLTNEMNEASRFLFSLPPLLRPLVTPVALSTKTKRSIADGGGEPPSFEAAPWGLSPHSAHLFETLREVFPTLSVPPWKDVYVPLTGRQTAAECLRKIQPLLQHTPALTPPCFCSNMDEIQQFMASYPPPYLLKTPYSCSGRGLRWLPNPDPDEPSRCWMKGAWKKQGVISIEQALDKVCDFALEFKSDGQGAVDFEGWSVFDTHSKGQFSGNWLGSQELLKTHLRTYVSEAQLREVQEAVVGVLSETLGAIYRGHLGVDMLIYRRNGSFFIHPMVELNLRYTMGLVALRLSDDIVHPSAQGRFTITCDSSEGYAYQSHLRMEKMFPRQLVGKKIRSGYLSLCPVTPKTYYRAYILVE